MTSYTMFDPDVRETKSEIIMATHPETELANVVGAKKAALIKRAELLFLCRA